MRDIQWDSRSGWSGGMGPSGRARRVWLVGKEEEEEPAGEQGDMLSYLQEVSVQVLGD
jgi:hypothetical protein